MVVPQKSPADDRAYKVLELPNKLTVLLVSDPTTDKVSIVSRRLSALSVARLTEAVLRSRRDDCEHVS